MSELAVLATAGTWHDQAPAVAVQAATLLRLESTHPDRDTMESYARAACRAIDMRLELQPATGRMFYPISPQWAVVSYASGEAPEDVQLAALQLTQELYRRKDARFGVTNTVSPTGEPVRVSRDQLAGVDSLLQPYVEGWGIG